MQSSRGFSLLELLVAMGLITIISAMAIPTIQESQVRNTVWTATEMIGVQVRQARLKAITRNISFRIDFDCPAARQMRVLRVTGDVAIDNAADRCTQYLEHDSGIFQLPANVDITAALPTLQVSGRGQFTAPLGGAVPLTISVGHSGRTFRSMTDSATGQISFETY
jgi:prepilin-type N-terminal cleavage/methylation domain-containing protein